MTPIDAILERLASLHPKKIDLSLGRMEGALARLGNPHLNLPPVIHVAGTNGKGSTSAFMRAILEAGGRKVHVYTSPHLTRFHERFRLGAEGGGQLVGDDELADILTEVERVNDGAPITQFEITTAAGLLMFARHPADALILEVGMGGRFDATNVVARPAASVITPVSMDHADYLGDTVAKIAAEKAGIIKRGRPVVVSAQTPDAMAVIEKVADDKRARLLVSGLDWTAREEHGRFVYQDEDGLFEAAPPRLLGRHQFENAGAAVASVKAAGFAVSTNEIATGLSRAEWPARLQPLLKGRLIARLPAGSELWLDGGHNEGGGQVLSRAIGDMGLRRPLPLVMITGMLSTKDPSAFLKSFAPLKPRLIAIPFDYGAALPPAAIQAAAKGVGIEAETAASLEEALAQAATGGPARVLVTGSLYLAGEVLTADGWVSR